jgi:hypothetical protein
MTNHPSSLGNTTQNYLGKSQYGDPGFLGSIEDFRIIGRALSAAEVSRLAIPAIVNPASGPVNPIVTPTTNLSVLASDVTAGESALTYIWTTIGTPPAPVSFSVNGTNAAKNTVATFTQPGTYNFQVTIVNPSAGSTFAVTSTTSVVVNTIRYPGDFTLNGQLATDDFPAMFAAMTDLGQFQSKHGLSNAEMLAIGDLNGDGKISNLDLQPLLNLVAQAGGGSGSAAAENSAMSAAPMVPSSAMPSIAASPAALIQQASIDMLMSDVGKQLPANRVARPLQWAGSSIVQSSASVPILQPLIVDRFLTDDRASVLRRRSSVATVLRQPDASVIELSWSAV